MRFLKSIAVSALLLLTGLGLAAQTRTVSGKVIGKRILIAEINRRKALPFPVPEP